MIQFVCICGEPFDVPAELAGESMQCPACRRLVDVPRLGEADAFADDGTVRMADANETPSALNEKLRAFGQRGDQRNSIDDFLLAGTGDPATEPKRRAAPRYDPITGELMLPVGIANDDSPAPSPVDTSAPVLGYARLVPQAGQESREGVSWWTMPWRLVTGWSLMAQVIIWAVHVVTVVGLMIPGFNVFFGLIAFFLMLLIVAHYCNTIEDFGPNDRDRVPVLLRSVSLGEDLLNPLWHCLLAGLYAFAPTLLAFMFVPSTLLHEHPAITYATTAWGLVVFPAALFTSICGGVIQNLAPRRVLSVVVAAPIRYALACGVFYAALAVYSIASSTMTIASPTALVPSATRADLLRAVLDTTVTLGVFALAVYLMHLAACWMGLIYRSKHEQFNWVLQRHERVNRTDVMSVLMNRRPKRATHVIDPDRLSHARPEEVARPALPLPGPRHGGFEVKL